MACVFYLDYSLDRGCNYACVFYLDYASDGGRDYYDSGVLFKLDLIWRA